MTVHKRRYVALPVDYPALKVGSVSPNGDDLIQVDLVTCQPVMAIQDHPPSLVLKHLECVLKFCPDDSRPVQRELPWILKDRSRQGDIFTEHLMGDRIIEQLQVVLYLLTPPEARGPIGRFGSSLFLNRR